MFWLLCLEKLNCSPWISVWEVCSLLVLLHSFVLFLSFLPQFLYACFLFSCHLTYFSCSSFIFGFLVVSFSFRFLLTSLRYCQVIQHHGWVFLFLSGLWQKLHTYVGWLLTLTCTHCLELMKVVGILWLLVDSIHVADDFWTCLWLFLLLKPLHSFCICLLSSLGFGLLLYMLVDVLLLYCQIWNLWDLVTNQVIS